MTAVVCAFLASEAWHQVFAVLGSVASFLMIIVLVLVLYDEVCAWIRGGY